MWEGITLSMAETKKSILLVVVLFVVVVFTVQRQN